MKQTQPNKQQILEAFTIVSSYDCEYSSEIEKLMLDAIQHSKEKGCRPTGRDND